MVYIASKGLIYNKMMWKGLQYKIDKNASIEGKHKEIRGHDRYF